MGCGPSNPAPEDTLRCFADALEQEDNVQVANCFFSDKNQNALQKMICYHDKVPNPSACGISAEEDKCLQDKNPADPDSLNAMFGCLGGDKDIMQSFNTLSQSFNDPISVVECFNNALQQQNPQNDVFNCLVMGDKDKDLPEKLNCLSSQVDPSITNPTADDLTPSSCGISTSQFQCLMGKYDEAAKSSNGTPSQEDMNDIMNCIITDPRNKNIFKRMSPLIPSATKSSAAK